MNAVLQSLRYFSLIFEELVIYLIFSVISSNIQQFSCYFKQLPSLEKHRWNGNRKAIVSARRMTEGDV